MTLQMKHHISLFAFAPFDHLFAQAASSSLVPFFFLGLFFIQTLSARYLSMLLLVMRIEIVLYAASGFTALKWALEYTSIVHQEVSF